jgi:hypothetical protein
MIALLRLLRSARNDPDEIVYDTSHGAGGKWIPAYAGMTKEMTPKINLGANRGKSLVYLVRTGDNGAQKSKKVHR